MPLFDPGELNRTVGMLGRLAAGALGALVVTGVPLLAGYRPDGWSGWLSSLHSIASALFLGCAAAVLACVAAGAVRHRPVRVGWWVAAAGFVVAGAGAATGQLVRWTGVRPPGDPRGLFGPLGGDVDAVVVGGSTVSPGTFLAWSLAHVVAVPALAVGVGLWAERRHRQAEGGCGAAEPAAVAADASDGPLPPDPPADRP